MLCFKKVSATKSLAIRGKYQKFLNKVCCLTVEKIFVGESFCAVGKKIVGNEKLLDQKEVSKFSTESLLSHSTEKLRRGIF